MVVVAGEMLENFEVAEVFSVEFRYFVIVYHFCHSLNLLCILCLWWGRFRLHLVELNLLQSVEID